MTWAWVRPADTSVLEGRPLLDLGTGDGQTLATLVGGDGLVVGVDRSIEALGAARSHCVPLVAAEAGDLPFRAEMFEVVVAGDLFHHLDDATLERVLGETRRILLPGGRLIAWWYEAPGRAAPDAPRYPRRFDEVVALVKTFTIERLELEVSLASGPPTVGIVANV